MRYDYQLKILESKGIVYHRPFANFILSKISSENHHSFLVDGDKDFILSYLLSKELKSIHVQNFGFEDPVLPCLIDVSDGRFELKEYDVIICLFPYEHHLKELISIDSNLIIFLRWDTTLNDVKNNINIPENFNCTKLHGYHVLSNF